MVKQNERVGDVFAFQLNNGQYAYGQVILKHYSILCILFDYHTNEVVQSEDVINKPIIGINNFIDGNYDGETWFYIANHPIAIKHLKMPIYLISDEVCTYFGEFVREATEEDYDTLPLEGSSTSNGILNMARALLFGEIMHDHEKYLKKIAYDPLSWTDPSLPEYPVYEAPPEEESPFKHSFTLEFPISDGEFGNKKDWKKKNKLESKVDRLLEKNGVGYCDGTEIGKGKAILFCYTDDMIMAKKLIKELLQRNNDWMDVTIHEDE